jgi:hypothetical protein
MPALALLAFLFILLVGALVGWRVRGRRPLLVALIAVVVALVVVNATAAFVGHQRIATWGGGILWVILWLLVAAIATAALRQWRARRRVGAPTPG